MGEINWRCSDRRIILPILLLPPGPPNDLRQVEANALIDTGATASGITPRKIQALGLKSYEKRLIGSAHGDQLTPRYIFRIGVALNAGDEQPRFPHVFEEVDGFEIRDGFQFDALLGMDILTQCDFSMMRGGRCRIAFGRS